MNNENLESSSEPETTDAVEPGATSQAEAATNTELRRLGSANPPGRQEEISLADGRRQRGSTVASVRTRYEMAAQELREALDDLEEKHTLGRLTDRQLRNEYLEIRTLEGRMIKVAEELVKANIKAGATAETHEINNEVVALQTRLGTLKQSLGDEISTD